MDLTNREIVVTYLKEKKLWLKKALGQHFLVNAEVLEKIIESAGLKKSDRVLEIGPGIGTLTQKLAQAVSAGLVLAIEHDYQLVQLLREDFKKNAHVKIIHEDALQIRIDQLPEQPYKLVANLPYQITGPLLRRFLDPAFPYAPQTIVVMLQKEVVDRLVATPGDSDRGVLTILRELFGSAEKITDVSKNDFFPVPAVDSAVVKITNDCFLSIETKRAILVLAKAGFAAKRRILANSLAATLRIDKNTIANKIKKVGLDTNVRAEDLSITDWEKLSTLFI